MTGRFDLTGKRILVAEDEFLIADDICTELREMGATVVGPAPGLEDAIRMASEDVLDGALLDINLNNRMSLSVADVLAQRDIPFVFATGYDSSLLDGRFPNVPVFTKPFEIARVAAALFGR